MKKKEQTKQTGKWYHKEYFIPLLLALFAFALYANTIPHDYNLDDELVTRNHRMTSKGISAIPEIFTSPYYEDEIGYKYEYRPVTHATFAIEKSMFGESPKVSHFFNVLLYALTAALLFITLSSLLSQFNRVLPIAISLLFIAHPLHTEVVASIKNRDEILAFLGGMASLFFAVRFFKSNKVLFYILALLCFGLAVLSKRSIIPFALIIPLAGIFFMKVNFRQLLMITLPVAFLVALLAPLFFLREKLAVGFGLTLAPVMVHLFRDRTDLIQEWSKAASGLLGRTVSSSVSRIPVFFKVIGDRLMKPVAHGISVFIRRRKDKLEASYQAVGRSGNIGEAIGKIVHSVPLFFRIIISIAFLGLFAYALTYDLLILLLITTFLPSLFYLVESTRLRKAILLYQCILLAILSYVYWIYLMPLLVIPLLFYIAINCKGWVALSLAAMIPNIILVYIGGREYISFILITLVILFVNKMLKERPYSGVFIKLVAGIILVLTIRSIILIAMGNSMTLVLDTLPRISAGLIVLVLSIQRLKQYLMPLNILWGGAIFILGFYVFTISPNIPSHQKDFSKKMPSWVANFYNTDVQDPSRMTLLRHASLVAVERYKFGKTPADYKQQIVEWRARQGQKNAAVPDTTVHHTQPEMPDVTIYPPPAIDAPAPQIMPVVYRQLEYVENPIALIDDRSKKIGTSIYVLGKYLQLIWLPHPLSFYYGYKQIPLVDFSNPWVIASLCLHILLIGLALFFHKRYPVLSFGILTYLLSIVIFSNLMTPIAGMLGERLAYIASLGFCMAFAYLLAILLKVDLKTSGSMLKVSPKFTWVLATILVVYSFKTFSRNLDWKDHLTLFRSDIGHLENAAQAHNLLAANLVAKTYETNNQAEIGKLMNEAIPHFKRAVEIEPGFFNAWYDLARSYSKVKDYPNALAAYLKVIELDSTFTNATLQAAVILEQLGRPQQAARLYRQVIQIEPHRVEAYTNLSFLHYRAGDYEASLKVNRQAITKNPQAYEPYINIGKTYFNMGDIANALEFFEKAYNINSGDQQLIKSLSDIYRQQGDPEKAQYYQSKLR